MESDSEASTRSSSPSPAPSPLQQSQPPSVHGEVSLQRLTAHFVHAKRSLSTTQHVSRANHLVTASRTMVEEIAVLHARNEYAHVAADDGVRVLEHVKSSIENKGDEAEAEFARVIEGLDGANGRLMKTLERLRGTVVHARLRRQPVSTVVPGGQSDDDDEDQLKEREDPKTLLSFIDTSKHESLQASLRTQIDDFNTARADLSSSLETFASHTHVLHSMLSPPPSSPEPPPHLLRPALYDEPILTIPQLFHSITDSAATMASLLQSLVSHYDLCVTALKHTEGGGEAARRAVQQSPSASEALAQSKENLEESLYRRVHASPISADERWEMLQVLEHDSEEVEDVVAELGEHARELESAFDKLAARARKARARDETLRQAVGMLHEMQDIHLPSHLHSLRTFQQHWARIRSCIVDNTSQLSDLSDFYAEFFAGYGRLLREVDRRSAVEAQMRKIAEKANKEIGRLHGADRTEREGFMQEVGSVLPGDLWPSLHTPATRWAVVEVDDEEEDDNDDEEEGEQEEDG